MSSRRPFGGVLHPTVAAWLPHLAFPLAGLWLMTKVRTQLLSPAGRPPL